MRWLCWEWGHLPAGGRCARCGAITAAAAKARDKTILVVILTIVAALVGAALGAWLDYASMP
jgi:uncharacterized protein (DUF983 family)